MKEYWKKIIAGILAILIILSVFVPICFAEEEAVKISAQSAVVLNRDTGEIYFEKNADDQKRMASTTKIMTCLVALENGNLQEKVKISPFAAATEGSSLYFKAGEEVLLLDLLYALMLNSGNDAANAIAEHIGKGKIENFVKMMNEKASVLKLKNTSFDNPSGLDGDTHYTTAKELGVLACYAMQNETFREIVSTKSRTIETSLQKRHLKNHNRLLNVDESFNGIKTGFTKKSGRCLVSSASKNKINLICVTLNASNDWDDHEKLMESTFSQLKSVEVLKEKESTLKIPVVGGEKETVEVYNLEGFYAVVKNEQEQGMLQKKIYVPRFLFAPITKGRQIGRIEIKKDGKVLFETGIFASESVNAPKIQKSFLEKVKNFFGF